MAGGDGICFVCSVREDGSSRYAHYAWGVLAFNLGVILWGAFVRATGSGAGCGSHWPLCNGEVVPRAPAVATLIEFGHRLSSGVALLLVAGLVVGAWRAFPARHPVRLCAALSGFFLVTEALIGAGLVLFQMVADNASVGRGFWVAGHLANTYLLVAALTLTAWSAMRGQRSGLDVRGGLPVMLGAMLASVLLLGVSGAVTALGDTLFPATSLADAEAQTFSETAHVFVRLRIWHPALAVGVGLCLLMAVVRAVAARPTARVRALAIGLVGLYCAQLLVGMANVWFLAPVSIQIVHLLISDLVWIFLILFAASVLATQSATIQVAGRQAG